MLILRQPKVEIAVRIEALDRLAEKALKAAEKFVNLGKLLAGIGEKIFDVQVRTMLPHVHGERSTIAPTRKAEDMAFLDFLGHPPR